MNSVPLNIKEVEKLWMQSCVPFLLASMVLGSRKDAVVSLWLHGTVWMYGSNQKTEIMFQGQSNTHIRLANPPFQNCLEGVCHDGGTCKCPAVFGFIKRNLLLFTIVV